MANLSDVIEAFLLQTLGEDDRLKISRNELANYFSVAPSQINYVLSTRFTPDRGYTVESRVKMTRRAALDHFARAGRGTP